MRPGWLLTTTPISDATVRSMLSVPMEHTDMRRSFGSERSTSSRHVTAPRVLMITSASLARSNFSSSVGRSVYTITSPNGASRSRWGEPWICIGSSPGTTMVNRPSKLIPFSASAPLRRKSPVGRLSPRPPESQGRRFPFDLAEHQCYHSLMQCDPIPRPSNTTHMLNSAGFCRQICRIERNSCDDADPSQLRNTTNT